ncbi:long-chain fatty acid--CoA ligase [Pantoea allii]|nr:class I adenylate-forming enzyme family protein [Pantoea allii]THB85436.1 long-chain fatty acid--CoA ligase [Pantoea allii]
MSSSTSKGPKVSLYQDARAYDGLSVNNRLIKRTTIPQVLLSLQEGARDIPALTWYGMNGEIQRFTYYDLLLQIKKFAYWFLKCHGITRGDRVIVISSNCPEVYITQLALMSIGAITVPVNNNESLRVLNEIIKKVNPQKIFEGRDVDEALLCGNLTPEKLPMVPLIKEQDFQSYEWPMSEIEADDPAVILFTSGTTSSPKGVCLSHYNLLVNAEGLARIHNHSENKVHMCIMPLFHANAFGFSLVGSIYAGNHVVLCSGLPGMSFWEILKNECVNIVSLAPEIIRVLTRIAIANDVLTNLKYVVSAAAPLPKTLANDFIAKTGIQIHQGYGLSECVNFAATVPWDVSEVVLRKLVNKWQVPSIGPSLFGCKLNVLGKDGMQADDEEEGEIVVTGHTLMLGYWEDGEATDLALNGGSLHTGDLGFFAEVEGEKYFFITGRKKEIVIRYGENISPLVIEAELVQLRDIGVYAVTGFSNESSGEEIGLYILANYTSENVKKTKKLIKSCPTRYRPRVVIFGNKNIPATPTGKIKRSLLAERFKDYASKSFGSDPLFIKE